ncbi:MAG: sensor protein, partial [Gemmatimonadetes bacterium]|nr:sensor protein [Gemmatimonadota bacterium]
MQPDLRPTGISALGDVPWGLHISLFYKTQNDLLDTVVAYFAAGLEAHELCVWAPSEPAVEQATIDRLRQLVPDVDQRLADGQLEFFRYQDWFDTAGEMDIALAKAQWLKWEQRAQDEGFAGLRASGNMTWVTPDNARVCHAYERALDDFTVGRRMLILCSYPIASTTADDLFDSTHEHRLVLARRDGEWDVCEIPSLSRSKAELQRLNTELEERVAQRSAQLSATNDDLRRVIEERRRVEADLRMSEQYLQHAQRLSHTGSFANTPGSQQSTYWSAETFRIFGLEPRA